MLRLLFIWSVVSAVAYGLIYIATKSDRMTIRRHLTRILVSLLVGLCITFPLFLINNLSGV